MPAAAKAGLAANFAALEVLRAIGDRPATPDEQTILAGWSSWVAVLVREPAMVVPTHMLEQARREFLQLYPAAGVLAAGTKDLTGDNRRQFVAQPPTGIGTR